MVEGAQAQTPEKKDVPVAKPDQTADQKLSQEGNTAAKPPEVNQPAGDKNLPVVTLSDKGPQPVPPKLDQATLEKKAEELHDAIHRKNNLKFWDRDDPDKDKIFRILEPMSKEDRAALEKIYHDKYDSKGKDDTLRKELKDKLGGDNGVDWRRSEAILNRSDNRTNDAGALMVAITHAREDKDKGNAELRQVLATLNSKQIAQLDEDFKKQYGMSYKDALGKANLTDATKEAIPILEKGVDFKTKDDVAKLAEIALNRKDARLFTEAMRGDSPGATEFRKWLNAEPPSAEATAFKEKVAEKFKSPQVKFLEENGASKEEIAKLPVDKRTDQMMLDYMKEGRISLATITTENASSFLGILDNKDNIELAARNASPKERALFNEGRAHANDNPPKPEYKDAVDYYNKIHKAFKDHGNDREVAIFEDQLANGRETIISQLAKGHSDGWGPFHWGSGHSMQDLMTKVENLSPQDWKMLNDERNAKPPSTAFRDQIANSLGYADEGERKRIMDLIDKKAAAPSAEEAAKIGRSISETIQDNKGTFLWWDTGYNGKNILNKIETMNADEAKKYKEDPKFREELNKFVNENLGGEEKLLAQRLLQKTEQTGEVPKKDAVDNLLHDKINGAKPEVILKDAEAAFKADPALRDRLNKPASELSEQDKQLKRVIDNALISITMYQGGYPPEGGPAPEVGKGYTAYRNELYSKDGLSLQSKLELGFPKAELIPEIAKAPQAQRDEAMKQLRPEEQAIVNAAVANKGELTLADKMRLYSIGGGGDPAEIKAALTDLHEKKDWATIQKLKDEYTKKYGGDIDNDFLKKVKDDKEFGKEVNAFKDLLTPGTSDGRQRFYDNYNKALEEMGKGFSADGSGLTLQKSLDDYASQLEEYQRIYQTLPEDKQKALDKYFNDSLEQYKQSKEKLAELVATVVITAAALAATPFTGGASLALVATIAFAAAGTAKVLINRAITGEWDGSQFVKGGFEGVLNVAGGKLAEGLFKGFNVVGKGLFAELGEQGLLKAGSEVSETVASKAFAELAAGGKAVTAEGLEKFAATVAPTATAAEREAIKRAAAAAVEKNFDAVVNRATRVALSGVDNAIIGGGSSAASVVVNALIDGRPLNADEILQSALVGAATGAVVGTLIHGAIEGRDIYIKSKKTPNGDVIVPAGPGEKPIVLEDAQGNRRTVTEETKPKPGEKIVDGPNEQPKPALPGDPALRPELAGGAPDRVDLTRPSKVEGGDYHPVEGVNSQGQRVQVDQGGVRTYTGADGKPVELYRNGGTPDDPGGDVWWYPKSRQNTRLENGAVKVHIGAENSADLVNLQKVLIPALENDPFLKGKIVTWKTMDPYIQQGAASGGWVPGPNGQQAKAFTIYAKTPEEANQIAKYIEQKYLSQYPELRAGKPVNGGNVDRVITEIDGQPTSNRVGMVRDAFEPAPGLNPRSKDFIDNPRFKVDDTVNSNLLNDPKLASYRETLPNGKTKLSDQGLRIAEQEAGIKPGTLSYDKDGNLIFKATPGTSAAQPDGAYITEGGANKTPGQKTDRPAMYALFERYGGQDPANLAQFKPGVDGRYTPDQLNQIEKATGKRYRYDEKGNLVPEATPKPAVPQQDGMPIVKNGEKFPGGKLGTDGEWQVVGFDGAHQTDGLADVVVKQPGRGQGWAREFKELSADDVGKLRNAKPGEYVSVGGKEYAPLTIEGQANKYVRTKDGQVYKVTEFEGRALISHAPEYQIVPQGKLKPEALEARRAGSNEGEPGVRPGDQPKPPAATRQDFVEGMEVRNGDLGEFDRVIKIDGQEFKLERSGYPQQWYYSKRRFPIDDTVKVHVTTDGPADLGHLQKALLPELENPNSKLYQMVAQYKTHDPNFAVGKDGVGHVPAGSGNDAKAFTIYPREGVNPKELQAEIDRILAEKGLSIDKPIATGNVDRVSGTSNRVGVTRDGWPASQAEGWPAAKIDDQVRDSMHQKFGVKPGEKLNADQLKKIEDELGLARGTLKYADNGNDLVLQSRSSGSGPKEDASVMYLDESRAGKNPRKPGDEKGGLTDRPAMYKIQESYGEGVFKDPSSVYIHEKGLDLGGKTANANGEPLFAMRVGNQEITPRIGEELPINRKMFDGDNTNLSRDPAKNAKIGVDKDGIYIKDDGPGTTYIKRDGELFNIGPTGTFHFDGDKWERVASGAQKWHLRPTDEVYVGWEPGKTNPANGKGAERLDFRRLEAPRAGDGPVVQPKTVSEAAIKQSDTFHDSHEIPAGQKLEDGFVYKHSQNGEPAFRVDKQELKPLVDELKAAGVDKMPPAERAEYIARYVHQKFNPPGSSIEEINQWYTKFLRDHAGEDITLGRFLAEGKGVCAQEATLIKALGDEMGLKVNLVRGDGVTGANDINHVWAEIDTGNGPRIYDPRQEVIGRRPQDAPQYRRGGEMDDVATPVQRKPGDEVEYNGEKWRVQRVNEDGSIELSQSARKDYDFSDRQKWESFYNLNKDIIDGDGGQLIIGRQYRVPRSGGTIDGVNNDRFWTLQGNVNEEGKTLFRFTNDRANIAHVPKGGLDNVRPELVGYSAQQVEANLRTIDPKVADNFKKLNDRLDKMQGLDPADAAEFRDIADRRMRDLAAKMANKPNATPAELDIMARNVREMNRVLDVLEARAKAGTPVPSDRVDVARRLLEVSEKNDKMAISYESILDPRTTPEAAARYTELVEQYGPVWREGSQQGGHIAEYEASNEFMKVLQNTELPTGPGGANEKWLFVPAEHNSAADGIGIDGVFINARTGEMIFADFAKNAGKVQEKLNAGKLWPINADLNAGPLDQRMTTFIKQQRSVQSFNTKDFATAEEMAIALKTGTDLQKTPMPMFDAGKGDLNRITTVGEVERLQGWYAAHPPRNAAEWQLSEGANKSWIQRANEREAYERLGPDVRNAVEVRTSPFDKSALGDKNPPFRTGKEEIPNTNPPKYRSYVEFDLKNPIAVRGKQLNKIRIFEDGRMAVPEGPPFGNIELGDVYDVSKNLVTTRRVPGSHESSVASGFERDFESLRRIAEDPAELAKFTAAIQKGDAAALYQEYPGLRHLGEAFTKPQQAAAAATAGRNYQMFKDLGATGDEIDRALNNLAVVGRDPDAPRALLLTRLEDAGIPFGNNKNGELGKYATRLKKLMEGEPRLPYAEAVDRVVVDAMVENNAISKDLVDAFVKKVTEKTGNPRDAYAAIRDLKPNGNISEERFYQELKALANKRGEAALDDAEFNKWVALLEIASAGRPAKKS